MSIGRSKECSFEFKMLSTASLVRGELQSNCRLQFNRILLDTGTFFVGVSASDDADTVPEQSYKDSRQKLRSPAIRFSLLRSTVLFSSNCDDITI